MAQPLDGREHDVDPLARRRPAAVDEHRAREGEASPEPLRIAGRDLDADRADRMGHAACGGVHALDELSLLWGAVPQPVRGADHPGDGGESQRPLVVRARDEQAWMRRGRQAVQRRIEEIGGEQRRHAAGLRQSRDDPRRVRALGAQPDRLGTNARGQPEERARGLVKRRRAAPPAHRKAPHQVPGSGALLSRQVAAPGRLVDRGGGEHLDAPATGCERVREAARQRLRAADHLGPESRDHDAERLRRHARGFCRVPQRPRDLGHGRRYTAASDGPGRAARRASPLAHPRRPRLPPTRRRVPRHHRTPRRCDRVRRGRRGDGGLISRRRGVCGGRHRITRLHPRRRRGPRPGRRLHRGAQTGALAETHHLGGVPAGVRRGGARGARGRGRRGRARPHR